MCHTDNENGKQHLTDGMELLNQDKNKTLGEKETYKYLGILEADTTEQVVMKEKIRKEYLMTKLCCRNLIKGINTWDVLLVRYSGPFLKWTREEFMQMDKRTRKIMTMYKALHFRDQVDRLYVSRKEGDEDLSALKTALTHRYNDLKTT